MPSYTDGVLAALAILFDGKTSARDATLAPDARKERRDCLGASGSDWSDNAQVVEGSSSIADTATITILQILQIIFTMENW